MMKFTSLLMIAAVVTSLAHAEHKPVANPDAPQKGKMQYHFLSEPTSLNPLSSSDQYSQWVHDYVIATLGRRHLETYEWVPYVAESWDVSKDGKTITFKIRDNAKWHDGKPITPEDVKFNFDAIMHPENKYKSAHKKPYFENIESATVLPGNKVQFKIKKVFFGNLDALMEDMRLVPKHVYENPDEKTEKKLNKTLIGAGPYELDQFKRGKHLKLKKVKDWWGYSIPYFKGFFNHETFYFKFVKDTTIALTMVEKGQLDYVRLAAEDYMKKAVGPKWGKEAVKVEYTNKAPRGYVFLAWNMKDPILKSKKIRRALGHLVNTPLIIDKFLFGKAVPGQGPQYIQSDYVDHSVKPIDFDPKKALQMFREEGWSDSDKNGILDKVIDGKKTEMSITILEPNPEFIKYLTVFKEEAKKAGVNLEVKQVEWNTFVKLLDERKFQAVRLAWGAGGVEWTPKQIWHSDSIANAGSNFISYSNKDVDKWIEEARGTLDRKKRIEILKKVYRQIAEDAPYFWFYHYTSFFYANTAQQNKVKDAFNYDTGMETWWGGF